MSISGTLLVAIAASLLKPLLCFNQTLQLPTLTFYDRYNDVLPYEESGLGPDDEDNLVLTLSLPQLLENPKKADLETKRQFDPWGGKRYSHSYAKDGDSISKRQFSPWGGKRSYTGPWSQLEDDTDVDEQTIDSVSVISKRSLNSWNAKRDMNTWSMNRNSGGNDMKKAFKSTKDKRNFKLWGQKKNFNAWGGKRFVQNVKKRHEGSNVVNKNRNKSIKRQAFNSWGGKRVLHTEPKMQDIKKSEEGSIPYTYSVVIEAMNKNES